MTRRIRSLSVVLVSCFGLLACSTSDPKKAETAADSNLNVKTVSGGVSAPTTPSALPIITGTWKSESPEPAGNGLYTQREYSINLSRWEMVQTWASDSEMKKPQLIYKAGGAYTIENASLKIPGAFFANFRFSRQYLNLKTKEKSFIKDFDLEDCSLPVGKEQDITKTGCSIFRPTSECSQNYDVVKLENGQLRLGEKPRDGDLCTNDKRPDYLGPQLKKIN
jgi:hypothetical protein